MKWAKEATIATLVIGAVAGLIAIERRLSLGVDWGVISTVVATATGFITWWRTQPIEKLNARLKRLEVGERSARADLSINLQLRVHVREAGDDLVIESVIEVRNLSNRRWCIPALYVSGRPWDGPPGTPTILEKDFSSLRRSSSCPSVSATKNIVQFPDTMIEMTPNEVESFVRIDRIPKTLVDESRFMLFNADLYGTKADQISGRFHSGPKWDKRRAWITFLNEVNPKDFVIFGRAPLVGAPCAGLHPGERFLRKPPVRPEETDEESRCDPDIGKTEEFREAVLKDMWVWSRSVLVDLQERTVQRSVESQV